MWSERRLGLVAGRNKIRVGSSGLLRGFRWFFNNRLHLGGSVCRNSRRRRWCFGGVASNILPELLGLHLDARNRTVASPDQRPPSHESHTSKQHHNGCQPDTPAAQRLFERSWPVLLNPRPDDFDRVACFCTDRQRSIVAEPED